MKLVVIALHGQGADAELDRDVQEALREAGAIVIAPTTSRRSEFNPESGAEFPAWMAESFGGKGYADELADFERGPKEALQYLHAKLQPGTVLEVTMMGSSLGGTMAADLAKKFNAKDVILMAPASNFANTEHEPLLGATAPSTSELLAAVEDIPVTVIRGEKDPTVSEDETRVFIQHGGQLVTIPDAGHTFGKLSFLPEDDLDKRSELTTAVLNAFNQI